MESFQPGNLVKARGREWVVLPESAEAKLFMVAALDDSTLQAKRPAGFERRPLLAKLSALSEVANQAAREWQ